MLEYKVLVQLFVVELCVGVLWLAVPALLPLLNANIRWEKAEKH